MTKKRPRIGNVTQSPLALPVTPPPPLPYRTLTVSRVPHVNTLVRHAWGVPREGLAAMSDSDFLLKWKWTHVAEFLYRLSIQPVGYRHSAHHHILPQIINVEHVGPVDAEFHRRRLNEVYQLDVDIPAMRLMTGAALNALIDQRR